jgi:PPOX class probable F420-dependent enzyme
MREQRRGRRIALSAAELDEYLAGDRTCRMATLNAEGSPHVSALWFEWYGGALWVSSLFKSQRWVNLERDPRVSVLIDDGDDYGELRGVEILGRAEIVGEVPRTGVPHPELERVEQQKADRRTGGVVQRDGRHAWFKVVPDKIVSWDFRKIG